MSLLASIVLLGGVGTVTCLATRHLPSVVFWSSFLPAPAILLACACFTIRGYAIAPDAILVRRLFWATRLPRAGLTSARFEPDVMRGSLRTWGNGGLFSISGYYRNKLLGSYRAYVTDPHQTVVLQYAGRTVVLSPAPPEEFVRELGLNPA
ncbi:MAG: hypothetical protein KGJ60_13420 [Verrucomicrobiota bacterium]|nr:hypothetical protein [Verrucomicrobiota bacterium]